MEGGKKRSRAARDEGLSISDRASLDLLAAIPGVRDYKKDKRGRRGAIFIGDATDAFVDALALGFAAAPPWGYSASTNTGTLVDEGRVIDPANHVTERPGEKDIVSSELPKTELTVVDELESLARPVRALEPVHHVEMMPTRLAHAHVVTNSSAESITHESTVPSTDGIT